MSKKLSWLDQFAEDFAKKTMNKTASLEKKAEQAVVDADALETTEQGATVQFNGESYRVVDANYSDEKGPGVLIEKSAAYEGLENDPMAVSMGAPATAVTPGTGAQEYARTDMNGTQQTYSIEEDAAFGQSSAPATESEIAGENAVDRTTVPGHYTTSPGLNTTVAPVVDAPVAETTEVPVEEVTEVTEEPATEEVAVEETTEVVEETPAVEETTEVPVEEVTEETTEEENKEDKLASNRIMARIFNSRK